jgi:homoserine O-acetyltransferase
MKLAPDRCANERRGPGAPIASFDVPLPADLAKFGARVRASLCGPADAPLVVALGGISADCFPCGGPDGGRGWWPGVCEAGGALDPADCRVLGLDFIADERGRAAPSTADQALIIAAALDLVSVPRARAIVGASYGGMIALAFGQIYPDRAEKLVVISADAGPHPAATATRELQRRVVALGLANGAAEEALSIARGLAMLTYRTADEFDARFGGGIGDEGVLCRSEPGQYLRARGEAFLGVMSPERFLSLSASIDRHRVDPAAIAVPTLLIGADSDRLVLPSQMEKLAAALAGPAALHLLPSLYGHDMFLKDSAAISALVAPFLEQAE